MKNLIISVLIVGMFLTANYLISQGSGLNLGVRYIKLSMSYREAHDYDNAFKYLNESQAIIYKDKTKSAKYWKAAIRENLAYTYKEIGMLDEAQKYLDSAINDYKSIITQPDGSPLPLQLLKENLNALNFSKEQIKGITKNGATTINYDNQKFKELPNDIPSNVENLSLANNRFRDMPSQIMSLKNLKYLNMANNKLKSVKIDFSRLSGLLWIDFSSNKIRTIDESIANLKSLNFLDLSNNSLKTLPIGLCNLKNLKVLNLKNNKIPFEQIAQLIKCLPNANILYDTYILKGNEIEE